MRRRQHVQVVPSSPNRAFRPPHATHVTLSHDCRINADRVSLCLNLERAVELLFRLEYPAPPPFFTARPPYERSIRERQSWPFANVRRISLHLVPSNATTQRFLCVVFLVVLVATAAFWTAAEAYEGQSTRSWGPRRTPSKTPKCKPPYSGHWRMVVVIFRKSSFSAPWRLSTHFPYRNPVYHFYMSALTKTVYTGKCPHSAPQSFARTLVYRRCGYVCA